MCNYVLITRDFKERSTSWTPAALGIQRQTASGAVRSEVAAERWFVRHEGDKRQSSRSLVNEKGFTAQHRENDLCTSLQKSSAVTQVHGQMTDHEHGRYVSLPAFKHLSSLALKPHHS